MRSHGQRTTTSGMIRSLTYDGNSIRQTDSTSTYQYDAENYLTALTATIGGAYQIQNAYDGDGARSVRAIGGAVTHYVGDSYENETKDLVVFTSALICLVLQDRRFALLTQRQRR